MHPEQLQKLVETRMPFGKYEGRLLADLPGNYLNWFAREGFPRGELGRLLALMHEIDHNGLSALLDPLRPRR
ncbi:MULTISPECIES: DUF3820 family protein [unclassified Simplicispira]|jgi:uncharacterized protein (DUF3820 family)|uniref:DUF3820 family protein n=1 Tax=unclassified Simplicispira TaxID=2630407 RepID=UPI000E27B042|nr:MULTISPECIES: DUF3820 family protein [unclassified Simplicispira]MBH1977742.1 DUF3820 family protein [Comamonadaceae bacterium]